MKGPRWLLRSSGGTPHAMLNANIVSKKMAEAFGQLIADRSHIPLELIKNPTLVHHGLARSARWHVVTAGNNAPIADLYGFEPNQASKLAEEIATLLRVPVLLLSNRGQPKTIAEHSIVRTRRGSIEHRPHRRNPSVGEPRVGEVWTTVHGGRCRILAVGPSTVKVLHLETGRRETIDRGDFFASYRPPRTRRNPSRKGQEPTRVRQRGTRVTAASSPEERIAAIRQIVHAKQYAKVDDTMIDLFTASAIVQVYDALNDANKLKFASFPAGKMGLIAFKLLKSNPRGNPARSLRARFERASRRGAPRGVPGAGSRRTARALRVGRSAKAHHHMMSTLERGRFRRQGNPRESWQLGLFRLNNGVWVLGHEDADEPKSAAHWLIKSQAEKYRATKLLNDGDYQVYKPVGGRMFYLRYIGPQSNPRGRKAGAWGVSGIGVTGAKIWLSKHGYWTANRTTAGRWTKRDAENRAHQGYMEGQHTNIKVESLSGKAAAPPKRRRSPPHGRRHNPLPRWVDKRSVRTITRGKTRLRIGCPQGKYSPTRRRCRVGTRAIEKVSNPRSAVLEQAHKTFRRWHEFDASGMKRVRAPRSIPKTMVALGELVSVVYRSNKYDGKHKLYEHETKRPRPVLATDPRGREVFIVGGRMKPTADGLVN